jgi:hypothetical protein
VGIYADAATGRGFLLSKGVFTTIDVPGKTMTALGINDEGDIVGQQYDPSAHPYLLSKGVLTTIEIPGGFANVTAFGINSKGDIVGSYSGGLHGFLLSK